MPHFCHIMTNNILHETSFSITSRHTFLFLIHLAYYKDDIRKNRPQSFKRFPKKVQWAQFREAVIDGKIASPLERISLCCSGFHVNFSFPVSLSAPFLLPNMPAMQGSGRGWEERFPAIRIRDTGFLPGHAPAMGKL